VGFRRSFRGHVAAVAVAAMSAAAQGEEAHVYVVGTWGLEPLPFQAANLSRGRIACGAAVAHWYSEVIGKAGPGGTVEATLWSDPRDGAVYLVNAVEARMPVEALWCGQEGRDVSTGTRIALSRRAGAVEPAIRLSCADAPSGEQLVCRRSGTD
jgi:hypothetical protein